MWFFHVYLAQMYKKGFVNRAFIQMFKQYNISYNGQRFQQSTKFDYSFIQEWNISYRGQFFQQFTTCVLSVSIIEYNLSIEPIYQYNIYLVNAFE
jgi:hypothetical protein